MMSGIDFSGPSLVGEFVPQKSSQLYHLPHNPNPNPHNNSSLPKKRRNLPGKPDPEAEVIGLSPNSLMATNRFICEICNKGFQRDQNLQLHRRGHNLPWKLRQKSSKDQAKKKVYICPEKSCVHHDPARALGDLTGIKKHFSRKHGEKKWKCEKCSKKYAVQPRAKMAGALNLSSTTLFSRQFPSTKNPKTSISIRASSESSSTSMETKGNENLGFSSSSSSSFSPPPNFNPPEPKRFGVRPDKLFDVLGASLSLIFRLGTGVFVSGYSASLVPKNEFPPDKYALEIAGYKVKETSKSGLRPKKPIEIYEFESCPFCRKVREIVAVLDLDILFYPCPRNGPNFRPKVVQMGGKQQFPYMVDPNTGVSMYESDDIIKYLVQNYGDGNVPLFLSLGLLTTLTEGFAMIGRMGRGSIYKPAKLPPAPLEIWAYEGSPFCKLVREVLVELELPHLVHCCARGSPKRQELYEKAGHFQVPYLDDPNTGVRMFESAEIVEYLQATYAL